jgi:hypothetical protein
MDVSLESVPRKGLLSEKVSSLPSVQRSYISDNELAVSQGKKRKGTQKEESLGFGSYQGCSGYDYCGIVVIYSVINCKAEGVWRDSLSVVLGCEV